MLTNNYIKLFSIVSSQYKITNLLGGETDYVAAYNDGGASALQNKLRGMCGINIAQYSTSYGVCVDVGFGSAAATPGDYKLDDSNFDNRKLDIVGSGVNTHTDRAMFDIYANFANNGNADVIVTEVGVYGNPTKGSSGTVDTACALLMRKVLDNTITIHPGETYNFNYRLVVKDN